MSYDEPRFIAQNFSLDSQILVSTGTFTASGHTLTNTPAIRCALSRAAILTACRGCVSTAGVSSTPSVTIALGGATVATFSISHTLGAVSAAETITTGTGSRGETPVVTIVHVGTASATQITPVIELSLLFREQFA